MRSSSILTRLALSGLLVFSFGCNSSDNGLNPDAAVTFSEAQLTEETTVNFELSSVNATQVDPEGKDAIFAIGWSKFFNPREEEVQERSNAFAIAPDTSNNNDGFHHRLGGKDMGTVTLDYGTGSVELLKVEMRNGGVFYNYGKRKPGHPRGMMHEDTGEIAEAIPFVAGQVYRFDATGSDAVPAISASVTAPTESLQITAPTAETTIDGSDIVVTWQGGASDTPLMVGLAPAIDRGAFERNRGDGPGRGRFGGPQGRGFSGRNDHGQGGPGRHAHLQFRYIVEDNTGSFTIPAADVQELLAVEGVKGALLQVRQMITAEFETGDLSYAVQLRAGDSVRLSVAE